MPVTSRAHVASPLLHMAAAPPRSLAVQARIPARALVELRDLLAETPRGPLRTTSSYEGALINVWGLLHGGNAMGMTRDQLRENVSELHWSPPVLSLAVARQRRGPDGEDAYVQQWQVDTQDAIAWIVRARRLELAPKADVADLAHTVVCDVVAGHESPAIVRKRSGIISIRPGEVPGLDVGFLEPLAGRHNRFRTALERAMAAAGFPCEGTYLFRRPSAVRDTPSCGFKGTSTVRDSPNCGFKQEPKQDGPTPRREKD